MHTMALSLLIVFGMIAVLTSGQSIAFAEDSKPPATQPVPGPDLGPKDVVKTILNAMKNNDATDTGIKTTWKFASPANQKMTGPVERFIPMVKGPAYAPLLNHKSADIREVAVKDDQAVELAIVTDGDGNKTYFVFELSRQTDGDFKGCWMTDGVMRVEPPNAPPKPAPRPPDGQLPV